MIVPPLKEQIPDVPSNTNKTNIKKKSKLIQGGQREVWRRATVHGPENKTETVSTQSGVKRANQNNLGKQLEGRTMGKRQILGRTHQEAIGKGGILRRLGRAEGQQPRSGT